MRRCRMLSVMSLHCRHFNNIVFLSFSPFFFHFYGCVEAEARTCEPILSDYNYVEILLA